MKNYKIAHGRANFSITKASGFQSVHIIYDDFVYFISRTDILGKDSSTLWDESLHFLESVMENRKIVSKIVNSISPIENGSYTPKNLIDTLNALDPEIVAICRLPAVGDGISCETTCMNFNLDSDGHVSFYIDKDVGLKSVRILYDDGYVFSINREQIIGKDIPQIHKEISSAVEKTAENRKTLANLLHNVFEENPKSDAKELLDLFLQSDPEVCTVCGISSKDYE